MTQRCVKYLFVINNYTEDDEQEVYNLSEKEYTKYIVVGKEVGENGTPHLQGFVYFNRRVTWNVVKGYLPRAHIEECRGTVEQNITYCKKDGNFVEYGTPPVFDSGRRSDIESIIDWLDGFIEQHGRAPSEREVARECPTAFLRYRNFMQLATLRAPDPKLETGDPNDWQRELANALDIQCTDDRKIVFFVDEEGGSGKSWFTRWYYTKEPGKTQLMEPASFSDMAYALDETKTVFLINVARGGMEYLQYRFLEGLKDRRIFSNKYESRMKILSEIPHVIVFCNEFPDMTKMSADRFVVKSGF